MGRKGWAVLLYLLPAIGVPLLLALYIGPEALLRYPGAALGLLLACEVTLALLRFKAGLGARLHERGSEALANRFGGVARRPATAPAKQRTTAPSRQRATVPARQPDAAPAREPDAAPVKQPVAASVKQRLTALASQLTTALSGQRTTAPTKQADAAPTRQPDTAPARQHATAPAKKPDAAPAKQRATIPIKRPDAAPARQNATVQIKLPVTASVKQPATVPARQPDAAPAREPVAAPTKQPDTAPAKEPDAAPTKQPDTAPARQHATAPAKEPDAAPARQRETAPTRQLVTAPAKQNATVQIKQLDIAPAKLPDTALTRQSDAAPAKLPDTAPIKQPVTASARQRLTALAQQLTTALARQRTGAPAKQRDTASERLLAWQRHRYLDHLRIEQGSATVQGLAMPGATAPALGCPFVEPDLVLSLAGQGPTQAGQGPTQAGQGPTQAGQGPTQAGQEPTKAGQGPTKAATSPLSEAPEAWTEGAHTLWDCMQDPSLQGQSLVIVGPPGSGKTALLQHATLTLAADRRERIKAGAPDRLPVLLSLRDCAAAILHASGRPARPQGASPPAGGSDQEISLLQIIQDSLAKTQGPQIPERWFETSLQRGRCLVMLDGLGQVVDPAARKQVVRWVERQILAYPKTRFVITSRPLAYRNNPIGSGASVLEVQPLSKGQIERLVRTARPVGAVDAAGAGVEDLLARIWNTPALARLALNPTHLTMMVWLHSTGRPLPGRRAELYAALCRAILDQGQAAGGQESLGAAQIQPALQSLAYRMMCQRQHEVPWEQVAETIDRTRAGLALSAALLADAQEARGLLVQRQDGLYGFAHRTFQEYLAAAHIVEQGLEADLVRHVIDPWWVETIRLYAAQADASQIILACLAVDPPAAPALDLAIDCMHEMSGLPAGTPVAAGLPPAGERLERALDRGIEDDDPERRRIVARELLDRHLQGLVPLDGDRAVDDGLITHVEYQLYLDAQRAQGRCSQPDHWTSARFPKGWGKMPATGVRFSDARAFCAWLTGRSRGRWRYRLPEAGELAAHDATDGDTHLPAAIGYWTTAAGSGQHVGFGAQGATVGRADLGRWVSRDLKIAHDLILDHGRDWNLVRDLDLNYSLDLTLDPPRGLHLDLGLTRTFARDRKRERALARDLGRDLDPDLERERAQALALSYARDLALQRTHDHDRDLDPLHLRALDEVRNLAQALDLVKRRGLHCDAGPVWKVTIALVRQSIRFDTLALLIGLDVLRRAHLRKLDAEPGTAATEARVDEIQGLERQLLDVYMDTCILEDRIEGRLPAVEGIRIVRERAGEQGTGA